jgi:hypothetical protein
MPEKVFVSERAIVMAGLANEVEQNRSQALSE